MASGHPEVGWPRVGYSCRGRRDTLECSANTGPPSDVGITPQRPRRCGLSQCAGLGGTRDSSDARVFEGKDVFHGSPCDRKQHLGTTCRVGRAGRAVGICIGYVYGAMIGHSSVYTIRVISATLSRQRQRATSRRVDANASAST